VLKNVPYFIGTAGNDSFVPSSMPCNMLTSFLILSEVYVLGLQQLRVLCWIDNDHVRAIRIHFSLQFPAEVTVTVTKGQVIQAVLYVDTNHISHG
jgi:hypothetical protein